MRSTRYFLITPETNEDALRAQYKALCLHMHPDRGGDAEAFRAMRAEYQDALDSLRHPNATPRGVLTQAVGDLLEQALGHIRQDPALVLRFAQRVHEDGERLRQEVRALVREFGDSLLQTLTQTKEGTDEHH